MEYVRAISAVKGTLNMNTMNFCKWVNKTLFHNSTLEPGFPRKASVETTRKCVYEMGLKFFVPGRGSSLTAMKPHFLSTFYFYHVVSVTLADWLLALIHTEALPNEMLEGCLSHLSERILV